MKAYYYMKEADVGGNTVKDDEKVKNGERYF